MKEIKLTQGKKTFVDDDVFDYLNQFKWFAVKNRNTFYAARSIGFKKGEKRGTILMHREVMQSNSNDQVDHRDKNGLNNTKHNLRICTEQENRFNACGWGRSQYKGVYLDRIKKKNKTYTYISAHIFNDGKSVYLGRFKTEEEAARAYDKKAKELHGEFAQLNFKT